MVDIPDIITCANFGDDRLRGLGVAMGHIMPFPIDFDRRPYNTVALPCECVSHTLYVTFVFHSDSSHKNVMVFIRLDGC